MNASERINRLEHEIDRLTKELPAVKARAAVAANAAIGAADGERLARQYKANQAMRPTGDKLADETARRGLLAQADGEDRMAAECDARADEAQSALNSTTPAMGLTSFYAEKIRGHKADAAMHRARADAHRRAAAAF
jgi:hypothetical protein